MKKLTRNQFFSVILVIGVFLLAFTLLNGWEKADRERYEVAVISIVFAFAVAFVATALLAIISAFTLLVSFDSLIPLVVAVIIIATVAFTVISVAFISFTVFVFIAVVAAFVVICFIAGIIKIIEEIKGNNTSKKVIFISLIVEAVAIILPVFLVTFC